MKILPLSLALILLTVFSGCAQKTKIDIFGKTVYFTPKNWKDLNIERETVFMGKGLKDKALFAGSFVAMDGDDFAQGTVKMILYPSGPPEKGNWPIYDCNTNSTRLEGVFTKNRILLPRRCYYIKHKTRKTTLLGILKNK